MPYYRTGKICYVQIPADDADAAAEFYRRVFGWSIRRRDDGSVAFDDTVGGVSGSFETGRKPHTDSGLTVHIMVADAGKSARDVEAAGGTIVQPVDPNSPVIYLIFRDPSGNELGIYEEPGLKESEGTNTTS